MPRIEYRDDSDVWRQVSTDDPLPTTLGGSTIDFDSTALEALLTTLIAKFEQDPNGNLKVTILDDDDATQDFDNPVPIHGSIAHDSADANNPVKLGAKAVSAVSGVTRVAANDRTDLYADLDGVLLTRPFSIADAVSGVATVSDGSSTSCIAAQGASIATVITHAIVSNSDVDTGGYVEIKDNTTVKAVIPCPMAGTAGQAGAVVPLGMIVGTANTAWNVDPSATMDTVRVTLIGFKVKV